MNDPAINQLCHQLVEFYDKISSWEHTVVKESELSLPQMHTIETLGHHGSLRMKELASHMGITTGTLTVMIDRLEKMNMVSRLPNAEDKRSFLITLTDEGKEHFEQHHKLHEELTNDMISDLNHDEIAQFSSLIQRIIKHI